MFALEQNNPQIRRIRSAGYGRYPNSQLLGPDAYEMEEEGLGDLGFSFKKVVKKVTKPVRKVAKVAVAPVSLVANKIVTPVLKVAEKIPIVGSVVKVAEKAAGTIVDATGKVVGKVPLIGGTAKDLTESFVPKHVVNQSLLNKDKSKKKEPSSTGDKADSSGIQVYNNPNNPGVITSSGTQLKIPQIPGAGYDYTQSNFQNPASLLDTNYLSEDRNVAPAGYEDYAGQNQQTTSEPTSTPDLLLYGSLALGGVVLITLLSRK